MPNLKICGITRAEDLAACHDLGVDYVGFNFYPGSRRYIVPEEAARIWRDFRKQSPESSLKAVVVSVDAPATDLLAFAQIIPDLSALQLHGEEPSTLVSELKNKLPLQIWKAVPVTGAWQRSTVASMRAAADLVLLDSAAVPLGAKVPGGSGKAFDWTAFGDLIAQPGIGVAGGIHPGNIEELLKFRPNLIDIASGAEAAPGVKSRENIESLVTACRTFA